MSSKQIEMFNIVIVYVELERYEKLNNPFNMVPLN